MSPNLLDFFLAATRAHSFLQQLLFHEPSFGLQLEWTTSFSLIIEYKLMNLNDDTLPWSLENSPHVTVSYEDVTATGKVQFSDHPASTDDDVPNKLDILCGRDKVAFNHVGNKAFRVIISEHRERYQSSKSREAKSHITDDIIASLKEQGRRFFKFDRDIKQWYLVSDEYAHEKVSHALRSAKDPKRKTTRKKRAPVRRAYTKEEDESFVYLLTEQKKIFRELLEEEFVAPESCPMDFSIADEVTSSSAIAV